MAKILIVEDDAAVSGLIEDYCKREHHAVEAVASGIEASERLKLFHYDLIILDWQLPDLSGIEVCRIYRHSGGTAAILMLTGKASIIDKESGFEAGADDYLTKPFQFRELVARVKASLRRPRTLIPGVFTVAHIALDTSSHEVTKNGEKIDLLPKEFALLELFLRNPNQVFSLEALLDRVWSSESDTTPEAVRTCLLRLRRKLDVPGGQSIISTLYGVGYRLDQPPEPHN